MGGKGRGKKKKSGESTSKKQTNQNASNSTPHNNTTQSEAQQGAAGNGLVNVLKTMMPPTYVPGEASQAKNCYEVIRFEDMPTVFDWQPKIHF